VRNNGMKDIIEKNKFTGRKARSFSWESSGLLRRFADRFLVGDSLPRILRFLDLKGDEVILDAGAGAGYYSFAIAEKLTSGKVISVDLSPDMLDALKSRAQRKHLTHRVQTKPGDNANLPLSGGSVDGAVTILVWHDMTIPDAAEASSRELFRVLKPKGRVAVVEWNTEGGGHGFGGSNFSQPFGMKAMKKVLRQAGFVNARAEVLRRIVIGYAEKP